MTQYEGMAVSTVLRRTNFPALERYLEDQLWARYRILSVAKMSLFFRSKCSGRPRYFPKPPSFKISSAARTLDFTSDLVLAEKVVEDFALLMHCRIYFQILRSFSRSLVFSLFLFLIVKILIKNWLQKCCKQSNVNIGLHVIRPLMK